MNVQQQEIDLAGEGKPTTFFDLPREIRDIIYKLALVPEQAIELAPFAFPNHPDFDGCFTPPQRPWGGFSGAEWHIERYKTVIQPSLTLLRASKAINHEAGPVYYGQEFRFSSNYGWHILHRWLRLIGPKNRPLVRHLTASHPGITAMVDSDVRYGMTYDAEADLKLSPVKTTFPSYDPHTDLTGKKNLQVYHKNLRRWVKKANPTKALLSLTDLRTLRFTLFAKTYGVPVNSFFPHDAAFTIDWAKLPNLRISVVNLVSHYGGMSREITLDAAYATNPYPLDKYYVHDAGDDSRAAARNYFDSVKEQGWTLEEAFYDNHYSYPVLTGQYCTNKDICRFECARWKVGCGKWE